MSTSACGGLETAIADSGTYARAVQRFREAGIALPTFAQLAEPDRIPAAVREKLAGIDPDAPHPLNLFRVHWFNDRARRIVLTQLQIGVDQIILSMQLVAAFLVGLCGLH